MLRPSVLTVTSKMPFLNKFRICFNLNYILRKKLKSIQAEELGICLARIKFKISINWGGGNNRLEKFGFYFKSCVFIFEKKRKTLN